MESQLLGLAVSRQQLELESVSEHLADTWFWRTTPDSSKKNRVKRLINDRLENLKDTGFLSLSENQIIPTTLGHKVNETMLSPNSAKTITVCLDFLSKNTNMDSSTLMKFMLIMAGLTTELSNNDRLVRNARLNPDLVSLGETFAGILGENPRLGIALQYGAVLSYWIDSIPTNEILELCGLDPRSDTASLEESLAKDIHWILTTIATIASSVENVDESLIKQIQEIAEYCRIGTSEEMITYLLTIGLQHIGRTSAIKIIKLLGKMQMEIPIASKDRFVAMFPTNTRCADLLYEELRTKGLAE